MTDPVRVVVGTYPPIPLPSADATLDEVRRAWEMGAAVTVVSPRMSAADLSVPIAGPLAGRRLDNVRRRTGATGLVLVAERGFPVPVAAAPLQWATVAALARSMRRFSEVRLVRVGQLGLPEPLAARLATAADEVVDRVAEGPGSPGVTPLGPRETLPREWPRVAAGRAARIVLGRRAEPVRARLGAIRRAARR